MGKKLGQNFLKSGKKLRKIVEALNLGNKDWVVEIGPGHGELTRELRAINPESRVILIEKDERLVAVLREKFGDDKNIQIIEGDALKVLPEIAESISKPYKIVGNIPYYITGHLFRIIGELKKKPSLAVFTVQKEVAERITAEVPKMNLLAASIQFWAEPKIISRISKKNFRPVPKVDSAVVRLEINKGKISRGDAESYYSLLRAVFKQPRKTVFNNLNSSFKNKEKITKNLEKVGIDMKSRPQNIEVSQLVKLSTLF